MVASSQLSAARRAADIDALAAGAVVDVLVVGGGVTGAGVALDAATRGLSVALLERADLATGTSRWSSKLVHGGLRYLAKGDVPMAWESARERALIMGRIAPHLVRALPFLIPFGAGVNRTSGRLVEAGVRGGDVLRTLSGTRARRLPPARRVSAEEARRWAPGLSADGLRGALLHWDGQLEDDARLVVAIARTAAAHGARIVTHAPVTALHADGATARDDLAGGAAFTVRARHVINATGVWAGELVPQVELRPSKGAHLLVDAARLGDPRAAVSVPVPGALGRFVFALPRHDGHVLVGLTDDPYDGPPIDAPRVDDAEERFLLDTVNTALETALTPDDVVGRFAGLRPLLAGDGKTSDLSRSHAVLEHDGVVSVVGGKLTTYRRMAEDAVDVIAAREGVAAGPVRTAKLTLVGGAAVERTAGVPPRLARRFGAEAPAVVALADGDERQLRPIAPGVPVLGVELLWARRAEGAATDDDVARRVRADLIPAWGELVRERMEAGACP